MKLFEDNDNNDGELYWSHYGCIYIYEKAGLLHVALIFLQGIWGRGNTIVTVLFHEANKSLAKTSVGDIAG